MGIFNWLLGRGDEARDWDRNQPPPIPAAVSGPHLDKAQTEKDFRRVEAQYEPETDRFAPEKESPANYD
jgi:hypothetical protein